MKNHILTALKEEFNRWDERLTSLSDEQITARDASSGMSIKDIVAHVRFWQQISIIRLKAAVHDTKPEFPQTPAGIDLETENDIDAINAWIDETHRDQPWSHVYRDWKAGFLRFLELSEAISENDLLDSDRYAWLEERPIVLVILGSYGHHQEHFDTLLG